MHIHRGSLLGLVALTSFGSALSAQEPLTAELKYKAIKKWNYIVPAETWTKIQGGIPIAHEGGDSFDVHKDALALKLEVDTNGDGKLDAKVKGNKGYLVLKAKDSDGESFQYAVRFKPEGKVYSFASSGVMVGKLGSTSITLIDRNNNGRFDEFGVDGMVVGKSRAASYLSKVINIGGELFSVSIDGNEITAEAYEGEAGTLNLASGFKSRGKLESVVVKSDAGHSFELAKAKKGLKIPAGSYHIVAGSASKSGETVRIATGKMSALRVGNDHETKLKWGGKIVAEFDAFQAGDEVKIEPGSVHYYGEAGEEYCDFLPQGASPKFLVYDEVTKKLLKTGRFGGC